MTTSRPPIAEQLDLAPHPEGGWFREIWRSSVSFTPDGYPGPRATATAIYFMLQPGESSRWHRVRSDELWFWHSGAALDLHLGGTGTEPVAEQTLRLGADLAAGQRPQALVPGGTWQSATPAAPGAPSAPSVPGASAGPAPVLVSCVVAPGFDFADFQMHPEA